MTLSLSLSGMHVVLLDEASTKCRYPSFLIWLCALSAGTPRLRHVWWSLLALFHSRASSTSGTDSSLPILGAFLHPFSLPLSSQTRLLICNTGPGDCTNSSVVCSRSEVLDMAIALLLRWNGASACSGPHCGSHLASSGSSAPVSASVFPSRCPDVWRYSGNVSLLARQRSCAVAVKLQ